MVQSVRASGHMMEYLAWHICPLISGVSKAASLRRVWAVPGCVTETSRREAGVVGRSLFRLARHICKMCTYDFSSVFFNK